ncbi:MAG: hypothetical protein Q8755_03440, partial [Candidatus Phytoplasma australasiaticum]|nr:hypothetical protein [Candidatus Phytoplasma australasiaticum]
VVVDDKQMNSWDCFFQIEEYPDTILTQGQDYNMIVWNSSFYWSEWGSQDHLSYRMKDTGL